MSQLSKFFLFFYYCHSKGSQLILLDKRINYLSVVDLDGVKDISKKKENHCDILSFTRTLRTRLTSSLVRSGLIDSPNYYDKIS